MKDENFAMREQHQNQESLGQPTLNASSNSLYKQFFEKVKKAEVEEVISMVI